jgi:hypothetical protein
MNLRPSDDPYPRSILSLLEVLSSILQSFFEPRFGGSEVHRCGMAIGFGAYH